MKKRIALVGLYLIAGYLWYRYKQGNSFWSRVPLHQWDQIEAQLRYGRQAPLDATLVLADVEAFFKD